MWDGGECFRQVKDEGIQLVAPVSGFHHVVSRDEQLRLRGVALPKSVVLLTE